MWRRRNPRDDDVMIVETSKPRSTGALLPTPQAKTFRTKYAVYVDNAPQDCRDHELKDFFGCWGADTVRKEEVDGKYTVLFDSEHDAQRLLDKRRLNMGGIEVEVRATLPKPPLLMEAPVRRTENARGSKPVAGLSLDPVRFSITESHRRKEIVPMDVVMSDASDNSNDRRTSQAEMVMYPPSFDRERGSVNEELKRKLNMAESEIKTLKDSVKHLEERIEREKGEKRDKDAYVAEIRQSNLDMASKVNRVISSMEDLTRKLANLESENAQLRNEKERILEDKQKLNREFLRSRSDLEDLEEKYNRLKKEKLSMGQLSSENDELRRVIDKFEPGFFSTGNVEAGRSTGDEMMERRKGDHRSNEEDHYTRRNRRDEGADRMQNLDDRRVSRVQEFQNDRPDQYHSLEEDERKKALRETIEQLTAVKAALISGDTNVPSLLEIDLTAPSLSDEDSFPRRSEQGHEAIINDEVKRNNETDRLRESTRIPDSRIKNVGGKRSVDADLSDRPEDHVPVDSGVDLVDVVSTLERQIFDFLGYMWLPILLNFVHAVFTIVGFFGAYQNRRPYLITYLVWCILWISWSSFVICLYMEVGSLTEEVDILSLGTGSYSWWQTHGFGCRPIFSTNGTLLSQNDTDLTDHDAHSAILYRPLKPIRVEDCLLEHRYVEALHAVIQIALIVLAFPLAVWLVRHLSDDDDGFHFIGGFGQGNACDQVSPSPCPPHYRIHARTPTQPQLERSWWPPTTTTTIDASEADVWRTSDVINGYANLVRSGNYPSKSKCGFLCQGGYSVSGHLPPTVHPMYNRYLPVRIVAQERTYL
ncbi:unnamed protein product [Notodromas monacha]|uniref:Sodium/potassium-transporting ATPase subunit beta-1-interacting protein n=1 Tax=Notodromas monacha TaxID=399045 RepID=A0A7R9BJ75_9CRUS|nr:unnamed protein product [Notodromas monacha]CAG0916492.1 unnamed protein product [Notodromas monacha]